MKIVRTPLERKLLDIQKELIEDVKIVKSQNDPQSHRNKVSLRNKINIVENALNMFRRSRCINKKFEDKEIPCSKEMNSYSNKISKIINEYSFRKDAPRYFIKMSKKDIKKGRLNGRVLKDIITYVGDTTWYDCDIEDTIEKIKNGKSFGIAFTTRKQRNKHFPEVYFSMHGEAEYIDVPKRNISFYEKKKNIEVIKLKDFLNRI